MSLWRREPLFAGLASNQVTVMERRGRTVVQRADLSPESGSVGAALAAMEVLLGRRAAKACPLRVVVSDRYATYFPFRRPGGVRGVTELQAAVGALFESRFGERVEDWRVAFDLCPGDETGIACALPHELVDGCVEVVRRLRMHPVSVLPHFVAAVDGGVHRRMRDAWFLVRGDGHVTAGRLQRDRWTHLRTMAHDGADSPGDVVRKEALRQGDEARGSDPIIALGDWRGAVRSDPSTVDSRTDPGHDHLLALAGARA